MRDFLLLQKAVGETPLDVILNYKASHPEFADVPMAYAGRLDPMASGALLILVGDECKVQEKYHSLDKEYEFQVLFGVASDTADVLGLLTWQTAPTLSSRQLKRLCQKLVGPISLPYPHFSSKTVQGKPLHTWTLEGRLDEITIPTKDSILYTLKLKNLHTITKEALIASALQKINSLPEVTDPKKALGADFRRTDVRASWEAFRHADTPDTFQIATFSCIASSGTYMRTLAEVIARECGAIGLAFCIHRTTIGRYQKIHFIKTGFWKKRYAPDNS
jgi:tRNA pseudouridine(55) synthase